NAMGKQGRVRCRLNLRGNNRNNIPRLDFHFKILKLAVGLLQDALDHKDREYFVTHMSLTRIPPFIRQAITTLRQPITDIGCCRPIRSFYFGPTRQESFPTVGKGWMTYVMQQACEAQHL